MAFFIIVFFIFFQDSLPGVLSNYTSENKAIFLFAPDNRSEPYSRSLILLTRDPLGLDTRNIKIFEVFIEGGIGPAGESYNKEEVSSIRKYYNIKPTDFYLILSHQNFTEIFRSDMPLDVEEIFKKFDNIN